MWTAPLVPAVVNQSVEAVGAVCDGARDGAEASSEGAHSFGGTAMNGLKQFLRVLI